MWKIVAFLFVAVALTRSAQPNNRVLVLVDDPAVEKTHSVFLKQLRDRGLVVTVAKADDRNLALLKFGELATDHLVLFAPKTQEFGGSISVSEVVQFIDRGGNVVVAGGSKLGDAVRDVAAANGFEFDDDNTAAIDHANYDVGLDAGDHTTLVFDAKRLLQASLITGNAANLGPILYRGGALVSSPENKLTLNVLTGETTTFSFAPKKAVNQYPNAIGKQAVLIGALQARNNARVVVTGSVELFSDAFINANVQKVGSSGKPVKSGNGPLVEALSKWVFQEAGVLRVKSVTHHLVDSKTTPREYTITDEVEYVIEIEELKNGKWVPFAGKDVQLEFVRIDPFVRTALKPSGGKLKTVFKLPDVYGVFKFLVDYRRIGYTHLFDVRQVSVRPLLHTQYERFIRSAYPYYASSFSMVIGVVLFSFVFLYYKETPAKTAAAGDKKSQ